MSNIIPLPTARGANTALDLFLRTGEAHYGQIASLYAEGRVPIRRVIFDASKLKHQLDFVKTLRDDGVELILDTKAAELAAVSRYQGHPSGAPWADGTLHLPDHFDDARCQAFAESIAREAVEKQFDRVFAPTHYLKRGVLDPWFRIDMKLCQVLRNKLDNYGGAHIAIDYVVIIEQANLRDEAVRAALLHQIAPLPFENVVLRASHFGADASAPGLCAFINLLDRFQDLGRPVIVDHVGGLVGRALLAFGVASGIAHGLDEHLRFDATPWDRAQDKSEDDEGKRGGAAKRVSVPLLDKSLTVPELNALAKAKGGHALIVCPDRNCCRSLADMIGNAKRHSITQESRAMEALNRVPDLMRASHFLEADLTQTDRFARQVKDLKPVASELKLRPGQTPEEAAENLVKRMGAHAYRNEKVRSSLEKLHSVRGLDARRMPAARLSERVAFRSRRP